MLAGLLLLPVLELAVAIEVGRWVGALPTLGALVLISILGAVLVRRQGSAAWRSLNGSLRAGESPSRELADAAVLVFAGVLLIAPGFVSDLFAAGAGAGPGGGEPGDPARLVPGRWTIRGCPRPRLPPARRPDQSVRRR